MHVRQLRLLNLTNVTVTCPGNSVGNSVQSYDVPLHPRDVGSATDRLKQLAILVHSRYYECIVFL